MKRNFFKYLTLAFVLTTLVTLGACAEPEVTPPPGEEEELVTPTPAEFEVISLDVEPTEVTAGETVTITAVVENTGGSEGTYAAILTVDGVTEETEEVVITAGSSRVVTFSLGKDTPGIYEIGVGELSSSLTVEPKLVATEVELKYDDGQPEGGGCGGTDGVRVLFSPPATPFTITKVTLYTVLEGSGEGQEAELRIVNHDLALLYSYPIPASEFPQEPGWVTIDIPSITVNEDFYVYFYPPCERDSLVRLYYDASGVNQQSEWVSSDGLPKNYPGRLPIETLNFMIRVVGTAMMPES